MTEITVRHNVPGAEPPKRDTLPSGGYHALIIKVTPVMTKFLPALQAISIEYQIVKTAKGSEVNGETDDKYKGRAIYQDYVLEKGTKDYSNQQEAYRMQQLMAATACPHKTDPATGFITFNTDHLVGKGVRITVTQKAGKKRPGDDPLAPLPVFNNVERVDNETPVDDSQIV